MELWKSFTNFFQSFLGGLEAQERQNRTGTINKNMDPSSIEMDPSKMSPKAASQENSKSASQLEAEAKAAQQEEEKRLKEEAKSKY